MDMSKPNVFWAEWRWTVFYGVNFLSYFRAEKKGANKLPSSGRRTKCMPKDNKVICLSPLTSYGGWRQVKKKIRPEKQEKLTSRRRSRSRRNCISVCIFGRFKRRVYFFAAFSGSTPGSLGIGRHFQSSIMPISKWTLSINDSRNGAKIGVGTALGNRATHFPRRLGCTAMGRRL